MRYGNNSSLSRSQSSGNVFSSFKSSLSVSPFSFSSNQLDSIPKVAMRRHLSNTEQFSDRSSGSTSSLNVPPTNRLDFRRHSVSPEPFIQRLGSFSTEEKPKITRSYEGQSPHFIEEEETDYTLLSKPFVKMNGHSSQDPYQSDRQKFLSMGSLRMGSHMPSQPSTLSYQHHHSSDNINGKKLTFKGKGIRKISADNNGLLANNSNVQLLSSKKLPSLDQGLDIKWEVSCSQYLY